MEKLEISNISDKKVSKNANTAGEKPEFYTVKFVNSYSDALSFDKERTRNVFQGTRAFDLVATGKAKVGAHIMGSIENVNTTPYEVEGRSVNTATIIRFAKESIQQAFRANGYTAKSGVNIISEVSTVEEEVELPS